MISEKGHSERVEGRDTRACCTVLGLIQERETWVTWDSGEKGRNKVPGEGRWARSQHVWREYHCREDDVVDWVTEDEGFSLREV